jgi:hypothetical protein
MPLILDSGEKRVGTVAGKGYQMSDCSIQSKRRQSHRKLGIFYTLNSLYSKDCRIQFQSRVVESSQDERTQKAKSIGQNRQFKSSLKISGVRSNAQDLLSILCQSWIGGWMNQRTIGDE